MRCRSPLYGSVIPKHWSSGLRPQVEFRDRDQHKTHGGGTFSHECHVESPDPSKRYRDVSVVVSGDGYDIQHEFDPYFSSAAPMFRSVSFPLPVFHEFGRARGSSSGEDVYSYNFPGDRTLVKLLVFSVFFVETLQTALTGADLYYWFISGFGKMDHLASPYESPFDVPIIGSIIALLVQCFFCVSHMGTQQEIVMFSIVAAVAAIYEGIYTYVRNKFASGRMLKVLALTWVSGNASADILIAGSLLFYGKPPVLASDKLSIIGKRINGDDASKVQWELGKTIPHRQGTITVSKRDGITRPRASLCSGWAWTEWKGNKIFASLATKSSFSGRITSHIYRSLAYFRGLGLLGLWYSMYSTDQAQGGRNWGDRSIPSFNRSLAKTVGRNDLVSAAAVPLKMSTI
ncbi:hypothetical protein EDB87DRAFT_1762661 [Lactarius vividus]|nr:hypothetical protein EDB87DRAFT_1762661 [Lactarius vividus]